MPAIFDAIGWWWRQDASTQKEKGHQLRFDARKGDYVVDMVEVPASSTRVQVCCGTVAGQDAPLTVAGLSL